MTVRADILAGRAVILINIQDTIDKQLRTIRSKLRVFANSMNEIGGDIFRGSTAGTVAAFFPVKDFVQFQDSLLFLEANLKDTGVDIKKLESYIRDLGRTTSFTSREVAEAATVLAQAGFDMEIKPMLLPVLDLARGARVDLDTAGRILSNVMSAYSLPAEMAGEVASKLSTAARLGTTDIVLMSESLKYALATFRQLNVPLEDALGMITMLSNVSMRGSMAGTSLNTAFGELVTKKEELAKLKIGITDEDLREPIKILIKLSNALKTMGVQEQQATLRNIFNIRGGRGIGGQTIQNLDDLNTIIQKIRASTDEARWAAEKMDSRLGGAFRRGLSAIQEFSISLGETTEGPLTDMFFNVQRIFESLGDLVKKNPKVSQTLLLLPPAALAASVGFLTLSSAMGKVILLIDPLLALNQGIFRGIGAVAGANIKLLKDMVGIGGTGVGLVNNALQAQEKVAKALKPIQEKVTKIQQESRMKILALEQKNQKKLIEFDRESGQERLRIQAANDAKVRDISLKRRKEELELNNEQIATRSSMLTKMQGIEQKLTDEAAEAAKDAQRLQNLQIRQQQGYNKQLRLLQEKQLAERKTLAQELKKGIKAAYEELESLNEKALKATAMGVPGTNLDPKLIAERSDLLTKNRAIEKELNDELQLASKNAKAVQNRQLRQQQVYNNEILILEKRQLAEREALALSLNKEIQEAYNEMKDLQEQGLKANAMGITKAGLKLQEEERKAQQIYSTLLAENGKTRKKLEEKQIQEVLDVRNRQARSIDRLNRKAITFEEKVIKAQEKLQKIRIQNSKKYADLTTKQTEQSLQKQKQAEQKLDNLIKEREESRKTLMQRQAKELITLQNQRNRAVEKFTNRGIALEQRLLKAQQQLQETQIKNAKRYTALVAKQQETLMAAREKAGMTPQAFKEGRYNLSPEALEKASKIENKLLIKQGNQRKVLLERNALAEASLARKVRKKQGDLNAELKKEQLKAPKGFLGFLTKERTLKNFLPDIAKDISGLSNAGPKIVKGFKGIDIIRTLFKGLTTGIRGIVGAFAAIGKGIKGLFSLNGLIRLGELLFVLGDKIPIVSDALAGLGKAFNNAFGNIRRTFDNIGVGLGVIGQGIKQIYTGEIEQGINTIGQGFEFAGRMLTEGLANTWKQFLLDIEPGAAIIRNVFLGVLAVVDAVIASIGGIFGGIVTGTGIVVKADGSLTEMFKSLFSPENLQLLFSAIIGGIESITLGIMSMIEGITNILVSIKETFVELLQLLPGGGEKAASLDPRIDMKAELEKRLEDQYNMQREMSKYPGAQFPGFAENEARIAELQEALKDYIDPITAAFKNDKNKVRDKFSEIQLGLLSMLEEFAKPMPIDNTPPTVADPTKVLGEFNAMTEKQAELAKIGIETGQAYEDFDPAKDVQPPLVGAFQGLIDEITGMEIGNILPGFDPGAGPRIATKELPPAPQLPQERAITGLAGIVSSRVGDFMSTRGNRLQLQINKLDKERNELLKDIKAGVENIGGQDEVFGP